MAVSASPSRYNSKPPPATEYTRRASSIPPKPVTPTNAVENPMPSTKLMTTVAPLLERRYSGRFTPAAISTAPVITTPHNPRRNSSNNSRFTDLDMIDDEEMPMDELQQVRKSRSTTPQAESIYPPRLVSPLNDSSDAVSSVSSAEENYVPRRRVAKAHRSVVTPPRNSGRSASYDAATAHAKNSSYDVPANRPRQILQSSSFDAQATPPRYTVHGTGSAVTDMAPRYIGNGSSMERTDSSGRRLDGNASTRMITSSSVDRLANVIRSNSIRRPETLTAEEAILWDVVQGSLNSQRSEMLAKRRVLERQLQESTSQVDKLRVHNLALQQELDATATQLQNTTRQLQIMQTRKVQQGDGTNDSQIAELEAQVAELQQRYDKAVEMTAKCQNDHERAIRAIQRVLADVNEQKEEQVEALQARIKELQDEMEKQESETAHNLKPDSNDVATLRARAQRAFQLESEMEELKTALTHAEEDRDRLQQEIEKKGGIIVVLEQELNVIKIALQNAKEKESGYEAVIARQRNQLADEAKNRFTASDTTSSDETESLRRKLEEKTQSLENAKALITSLEAANGAMALDLRAKLKGKDEQVLVLKSEAADRRRMMDSLATELKDLQTVKIESVETGAKIQENMLLLSEKLEKAIGELQSATVILESNGSGNDQIMDEISLILSDTLGAIKSSLTAVENGNVIASHSDRQPRSFSGVNDLPTRDIMEKYKKMDSKVKSTEVALKKAEGEITLLKLQNERLHLSKDQEEGKLREEIQLLRNECQTNLETLERKKQELQVLRDSLEVGDGVGYISGDESDEEEGEQEAAGTVITASQDTLATLLARGGVDMADTVNAAELDKMKTELKKVDRERQKAKEALKVEQESLANAKMIISSLEKANKTMLEDLRSRLQDSNTAIAALLDKSMVNEKLSKDLKEELEKVKKEKETADAEHQAEISKLKDEALVNALRLAAKEREVSQFTGYSDSNEADGDKRKEEEEGEKEQEIKSSASSS
jgi:hypothetical protein